MSNLVKPMTNEQIIQIIKDEIDGHDIEKRFSEKGGWEPKQPNDNWAFTIYEYRRKPEPVTVPTPYLTLWIERVEAELNLAKTTLVAPQSTFDRVLCELRDGVEIVEKLAETIAQQGNKIGDLHNEINKLNTKLSEIRILAQ